MSTKTNNLLSDYERMHEKLITRMIARLDSDDCSASDFNVARQMLKDNGVNAIPAAGTPLNDLAAEVLKHTQADDALSD